MRDSYLIGLRILTLLDLSKQVVVSIAFSYLLGQLHKLVHFLLPSFLVFL
jgi:hypothetical protein